MAHFTQITHLVLYPPLKQSYLRVNDQSPILSTGLFISAEGSPGCFLFHLDYDALNMLKGLNPPKTVQLMVGLFCASVKEITQCRLTPLLELVIVKISSIITHMGKMTFFNGVSWCNTN